MDVLPRKEQIKRVAAHMFRKRGYMASSMRDIAREMGMEAPSLYNHIDSKQQILAELLLAIAHYFSQGMKEIKESRSSDLEKLESLVKLHVDITIDENDAVALLTGEWIHLEGASAKEYLLKRDAYEKDFRNILASAIGSGELEDVDLDLTLFSILSTLRWLYSWYARNPEVDKEELEKQMVRILIPRKKA